MDGVCERCGRLEAVVVAARNLRVALKDVAPAGDVMLVNRKAVADFDAVWMQMKAKARKVMLNGEPK